MIVLFAFLLATGNSAFASCGLELLPPIKEIHDQYGRTPIHQTVQRAIENFWDQEKIFAYDPSVPREQTFVVDTPPPTLSGDLHLGHLVSFMQADTFIRFQRMQGKNVFFPLGWDSNGQPTYDRIVKKHGVTPSREPKAGEVSFAEFEKLASKFISEDKATNVKIMRDAGLSVDPALSYDTLDWNSRRTAQTAFLKLARKGEVYFDANDDQWKMKMAEHAPRLREMASDLTILPTSRFNDRGVAQTHNYLKKMVIPWLYKIDRDWNLTRFTPFGVPVPVWYPIDQSGSPDYSKPIYATTLPVDPRVDVPDGFTAAQRDLPGGFVEEKRYLSTWATSALTPLIQARYGQEDTRNVFPADFRWQGHDIIANWLTYSLLASDRLEGQPPFSHLYMNGMIVDTNKAKLSKSAGNGANAETALADYPSDYIRQLALDRNLGEIASGFSLERDKPDLLPQLSMMIFAEKIARFEKRLGTPELILMNPTFEVQRAAMNELVRQIAKDYREMDFGALRTKFSEAHQILSFFLVFSSPVRIDRDPNALAFFKALFKDYLRMCAPAYPFITELAWQHAFAKGGGEARSVHLSGWPQVSTQDDPRSLQTFLLLSKILSRDLDYQKSFPPRYRVVIEGREDLLQILQEQRAEINLDALIAAWTKTAPEEITFSAIRDRSLSQRVDRLGVGYGVMARVTPLP